MTALDLDGSGVATRRWITGEDVDLDSLSAMPTPAPPIPCEKFLTTRAGWFRMGVMNTTTSTTFVLDPATGAVWEAGVNDAERPDWPRVREITTVELINSDDTWVAIGDLLGCVDPDPTPASGAWWLTDAEGFGVSTFADLAPGESRQVTVWTRA